VRGSNVVISFRLKGEGWEGVGGLGGSAEGAERGLIGALTFQTFISPTDSPLAARRFPYPQSITFPYPPGRRPKIEALLAHNGQGAAG
jgi:hypothetical protein